MRLRKNVLLFVGIMIFVLAYHTNRSAAEVNINIGIGVPPPPVVIAEPPSVILIPGTYAYFVPNIDVDIIFYHGYWYRPYKGCWYRSRVYNGQWGYLAPARVPHALLHLPPNYRHSPLRHEPIPYGHLKKHWYRWEKEKHWQNKYKHEYEHVSYKENKKHKNRNKYYDD
jgi:hypothetical protein